MAAVHVYSLESPSDAEVEEVAKVATDAFVDDIYIMMMTGGEERFKLDLFRLSVLTTVMEGNVTVCQDRSTKEILTVALSFGPGKMFLSSDKQRGAGIDDYIKKLSSEGQKWWEKFLKDAENFPSQVIDNWYTIVLATKPTQQRKGYASLVMKEVTKMAERDGTFAVLRAADVNVPFYQSLGFKVQDTLETNSPYGTYIDHTMVWKPKEIEVA